jgi:hypothetical protein
MEGRRLFRLASFGGIVVMEIIALIQCYMRMSLNIEPDMDYSQLLPQTLATGIIRKHFLKAPIRPSMSTIPESPPQNECSSTAVAPSVHLPVQQQPAALIALASRTC